MKHIRPSTSQHNLARLSAWTKLMLVWMASVWCATFQPKARHLRRRGAVSLNTLAGYVAAIIYMRAVNTLRLEARPKKHHAPFAIPGFKQRLAPRNIKRAAHGSWLRKQLRHRDPATRIIILLRALRHADAYAARIMPRLDRRLTRLWPRTIARALADALRSLAAPKLRAADTS